MIRGTTTGNLLRSVGKMSPEGNGLMARLDALGTLTGFGVGGTTGGLASAAVPVAGFAAKRMADAVTTRAAVSLGDLFRAGGDRAALQAPANWLQQAGATAPAPITTASLGALYAPTPGQLQVYNGLPPGAH